MNEPVQFLISHGAVVLFAMVFVEQAGLPLPAAPWLLAAGALWAGGKLNPVPPLGVVTLAALIADSLWFYLGRRGGRRVLRPFCRLSLSRNSCVGRSKHVFERHGLPALVAAKFLPGLGTVMPPLAGAMGMSTARFVLFDGLGSLVYGATYIVAGFLFHNQLERTLAVLNHFGIGALVLSLVLVSGYIGFKYARRLTRPDQRIRQARPAAGAGSASDPAGPLPGRAFDSSIASAASEGMSALEPPSVALALTRSTSQSAPTSVARPAL